MEATAAWAGVILTAIALVSSVAIGWGALKAMYSEHERRILALENKTGEHGSALNSILVTLAKISERLEQVIKRLDDKE